MPSKILTTRVRSSGAASLLRLSALALVACNAIAGIGEPILETSDGSAPEAGAEAGPPDGGDDGGDVNNPDTNVPDTNVPDTNMPDTNVPDTNRPDTSTPPPPPSKPGFDVTAGGTYGRSASYRLIAVVGESPGGNNVGKSQSYVLKAGVIATTQPN